MASQSASYARLLVQKLFVRTPNNQNISTNHILIADGYGGTYWNSVSSIFPVSSFKTIVGGNNLASTFSADVNYNTLLVSTTAIPSTFGAYVDPTTSSLMFSLQFPPIIVSGGSVALISDTDAVPNSNAISPVSLQSTVKFYGAGDVKFSTVNTKQAIYIGISSFTATGYSTLKGAANLSMGMLSPQSVSFVSSIPYELTSGNFMSTNASGDYVSSLFTSSIRFDTQHLQKYINMTNLSTSIVFDYKPNYLFPHLCTSNEPLEGAVDILLPSTIKRMVSYIQGTGTKIFSETSTVRYITSQNISTSAVYSRSLSNYYTESVRMNISSYDLSTQIGANISYPTAIYHRIDNCLGDYANQDVLFANSSIKNLTEPVGALYVTVNNMPIPSAGSYGNPLF